MVLRFLIALTLVLTLHRAKADCDITKAQLYDLRTAVVCACNDNTQACMDEVDAMFLASPEKIAAATGSSLGVLANMRAGGLPPSQSSPSKEGRNIEMAAILETCAPVPPKELKQFLALPIDKQFGDLQVEAPKCAEMKSVVSGFLAPHYSGQCLNGGGVKVSPKNQKVEYTILNPSKDKYEIQFRSAGDPIVANSQRPMSLTVTENHKSNRYLLRFVNDQNQEEKPAPIETNQINDILQSHAKEWIEMAKCCASVGAPAETCQGKYKLEAVGTRRGSTGKGLGH